MLGALVVVSLVALLVIKAPSALFSRSHPNHGHVHTVKHFKKALDTELFGNFDLAQQEALIEQIYQRSQPFQNKALQEIGLKAFDTDLALRGDTKSDVLKWVWDFFPPSFNCPLKERFGRQARIGDGGKWVCGVETLMQRPGCVVYSFGSNGETEFEEAVLATTHCEVHVFDPTLSPEALVKLKALPSIQFHPIGLGPKDQQLQMTDNKMTMGRHSAEPMNIQTLQTIMRNLNHTWIDVLKMDIEGFEYATLQGWMHSSKTWLPVTQLLVEFHYWQQAARTVPRDILATMTALTSNNLRVFSTEPNWWWTNNGHDFIEYSFLHVDHAGKVMVPQ